MRAALIAAGIALCTGPAWAQVALPLAAPEGAHPLVREFLEICSTSLTDAPGAVALAGASGWDNAEDDMAARLAAAAFGQASLTRDVDGEAALLLIQHMTYPHVVASSCMLQLFSRAPADLDVTAIAQIPGIEGGLVPAGEGAAGRWSFIDATDEVVTVTTLPLGAMGLMMTMARSERVPEGQQP